MLRTIIFSFVNKNYYYIAILFLGYVFLFASKNFVFSYFVEVSLNFKLERILFKKKTLQRFFNACRVGWTYGTYSSAQMYFYLMFLPFQYAVLCYSSVSSAKIRNFMINGKTILIQAAWFFFYFMLNEHIS